MNTWLKEHGTCWCDFQDFTNKRERDFAASRAHKLPGYIKHNLGEYTKKPGKGRDSTTVHYTLAIYMKEEPK
jgi:hypothetical protein